MKSQSLIITLADENSTSFHFTKVYIRPLYQRLASDELLEHCIQCAIQNVNESFHSIMRNKFPKDKFAFSNRVRTSVSADVYEINFGDLKTM
ncbi:hypothetical protein CDAR_505341 [Caerostris darwini]|uniref:Uncharacterized protein n=1 Tax=Caerostris darwini TaxID=1538125 RepID=A0AAV4UP55_9ARAC|nr:hypothetical protein CDAR_505341 [Caerostris darwini]